MITVLDLAADGSRAAMLIDTVTRPAEIALLDLDGCEFRYLTDTRPAALKSRRTCRAADGDAPSGG